MGQKIKQIPLINWQYFNQTNCIIIVQKYSNIATI